jgi:Tfp pilus assembly protein PilO
MNVWLQQFLAYTRRNPVLVVSLAIIVIMGGASYFLWQRQKALTTEHAEIQRSGEDILQSLTGHARLTSEIATVKEALDYIDRNLIIEGDLAENLGYFYQIETASRLRFSQLNQLSSQPQPPGSYYKPVPFTLLATGTYRQIIRLLHELESGPRLLRIRTYVLSHSGGRAASPTDAGPAAEVVDLVTLEVTVELLARP